MGKSILACRFINLSPATYFCEQESIPRANARSSKDVRGATNPQRCECDWLSTRKNPRPNPRAKRLIPPIAASASHLILTLGSPSVVQGVVLIVRSNRTHVGGSTAPAVEGWRLTVIRKTSDRADESIDLAGAFVH